MEYVEILVVLIAAASAVFAATQAWAARKGVATANRNLMVAAAAQQTILGSAVDERFDDCERAAVAIYNLDDESQKALEARDEAQIRDLLRRMEAALVRYRRTIERLLNDLDRLHQFVDGVPELEGWLEENYRLASHDAAVIFVAEFNETIAAWKSLNRRALRWGFKQTRLKEVGEFILRAARDG